MRAMLDQLMGTSRDGKKSCLLLGPQEGGEEGLVSGKGQERPSAMIGTTACVSSFPLPLLGEGLRRVEGPASRDRRCESPKGGGGGGTR